MKQGFWTSAKLLLLLVVAVKTLMPQHASSASYSRNETDRLALISFKHQISDDPNGVLKSWNDSKYHCYWEGVSCDARHGRVTSLALTGMRLLGSISPHIGNLSFLNSIQLGDNRFHGDIPQEVGRLVRLRVLNLSNNTLIGEIPVNLSYCSQLRNISLQKNGLRGKIPSELGSLEKLVSLRLGRNNLTNEIPRSFGNLSSLELLVLQNNFLEGSLPIELGSLMSFSILSVDTNKLSGAFPPSLFNISSITVISLAENSFHGSLPTDIGLNLPNLQALGVGGNQFYGIIPDSITNASKLEVLDISGNKFKGLLPSNLGNLQNLQRLLVAANSLGRSATGDLDFIASLTNCSNLQRLAFSQNNFGGELPNSIVNLSVKIVQLYMGGNMMAGSIPTGFARLTGLYLLGMEYNFFSGTIPKDFSELQNLQGLNLAGNMLSGPVPSTLCNITSLYILGLQNNNLEGTIPSDLDKCQNLKILDISYNKLTGILSPKIFIMSFSPTELDLSHNSLTGPLPPEVGKLSNINALNVSYNKLSGQIPETLGDCSNLEYLNMQGNHFRGRIPPKLGSLKGIQYMDLSQNNLSGQIPKDFESLKFLNYLNLSFNNLEGEVPSGGVFRKPGLLILSANSNLCGGIPELQLRSCYIKKRTNRKLWIAIVVPALFVVIVISAMLFLCYRRRQREKDSTPLSPGVEKILRISYFELQRATSGFSPENFVGAGGFGVVYKGQLDTGRFVAVKVLNLQKIGASTSFKTECNALRSIRHRNLVPLLTYCSSIDSKGHEFKAIVYEFMENGNLDAWLHPTTTEQAKLRNLSLLQRLNIAIDVASALQYLHNHCAVIVVHCDLKPSNILLDNDLIAHVGDFGIARLLSPKTTEISSQEGTSSTVAIKGSIGYAAPEYAMGCEASTFGDVYSYGILLLEMLTGSRPTDDIFVDGLDLHNYVKTNLLKKVRKIIDPCLDRPSEREENKEIAKPRDEVIQGEESNGSLRKENVQKCIISILEIGIKCSETSPNDRMDMNEAIRQLQAIREFFLRGVSDTRAHAA